MAPARVHSSDPSETGYDIRLAARSNKATLTSGLAPTYLQANLIVLPSRYVSDFRLLCQRNPVPCPLLAESATVGSFNELKSWLPNISPDALASNIDIRTDAPRYMIYCNGILEKSHGKNIRDGWTEDHVAFLIGCSYSFESALAAAGLPPRHTVQDRSVPMYRTSIPMCPAGVFTGGTYVVSMRPYKLHEVEAVRSITRLYVTTHGEPLAWGWDAVAKLGIRDLRKPDWGDAALAIDGQPLEEQSEDVIPIFWGCGITPQEAVMRADLKGIVLGHAPGHMIVLDVREWDVLLKD